MELLTFKSLLLEQLKHLKYQWFQLRIAQKPRNFVWFQKIYFTLNNLLWKFLTNYSILNVFLVLIYCFLSHLRVYCDSKSEFYAFKWFISSSSRNRKFLDMGYTFFFIDLQDKIRSIQNLTIITIIKILQILLSLIESAFINSILNLVILLTSSRTNVWKPRRLTKKILESNSPRFFEHQFVLNSKWFWS